MKNHIDILGKKILIVTAHPDDEAFLATGLIYNNKEQGGTTYLYSATVGERGNAYVDPVTTIEDLKILRKRELENAAEYLGINKIILDNFPDRDLEHYVEKLTDRIREITEQEKPEYIVGFGEDGYTGHNDHITIGLISQKIAEKDKIPYLAFSHPPQNLFGDISEFLIKKRANGNYFHEIKNQEPNICIPIDGNLKLNALKIYQSQFPGLDPYKIFPEEIAKHLLENEYFLLK
jgi:LmbE family N-acetylglucosaminyl deacetylase